MAKWGLVLDECFNRLAICNGFTGCFFKSFSHIWGKKHSFFMTLIPYSQSLININ